MPTQQEIIDFQLKIEQMVEHMNLSYFDAVLHYSEKNDIEMEVIAKMVTGNLKLKIASELELLNLVKKSNIRKLPI